MDPFTKSYIECALWSSSDDNDNPLDDSYDPSDLAEETLNKMIKDCRDFQEGLSDLLAKAYTMKRETEFGYVLEMPYDAELAGHDFWLTRNGHGSGFWDQTLGEIGDKLTEEAEAYGETNLYIGDDGKIYYSP